MMRQPDFKTQGLSLYSGDVRDVLKDVSLVNVSVLLTDPPYAAHKYLVDVEESGHIDVAADAQWSADVFTWMGQWWWPVRQSMAPAACGWIFANIHYVGFYLRWARLTGWPLRGIFCCPPDEFLLAFGYTDIGPVGGREIQEICRSNTYGQNKPLPLLRVLLHYSEPGLVFDPFTGLGSTLQAARLEGRDAIGVEIRPPLVAAAVAKLGAN